jgi:DNA polymerase III alpha subunit (gram-positive type)
VFHIDTIGSSCTYHDFVEICTILAYSVEIVTDMYVTIFHSIVVKPPTLIISLVTGITVISSQIVESAPSFWECGTDLVNFLKDSCNNNLTVQDFGGGCQFY